MKPYQGLPSIVASLLVCTLSSSCALAAVLAWEPSAGPGIAGYTLHVGYASGIYEHGYDVGMATSVTLPPLVAGRPHYFSVSAYDAMGRGGAFADEIALSREQVDALPISVSFAASASIGVAPLAVRLTPAASGGLLRYRWETGDGGEYAAAATGPLPDLVHTYAYPGTFSVSFSAGGPAGQASSHRSAAIRVVDASASGGCPCTLWGESEPEVEDDGNDRPVTVGMRFVASREGAVVAIRFFRSVANTGPHVGDLWTAEGQHLASLPFASGSGAGWQEASFETPVPVSAGRAYVVSYHAPRGRTARDHGAFLKNVESGPLLAPAHTERTGNGLHAYAPTSTFPRDADKASNRWVDVVFMPTD